MYIFITNSKILILFNIINTLFYKKRNSNYFLKVIVNDTLHF